MAMERTCRQLSFDTPKYEEALKLRADVLRKPLGLEITDAERAQESSCFHLGCFEEDRLIAILLLQPLTEERIKMRQVAVHPDRRKFGVGSQLVAFAEAFAQENGYKTIVAHARRTAVGFYTRMGYTASGEEFIEATLPHRLVIKNLS